jgi:hypothetical protein
MLQKFLVLTPVHVGWALPTISTKPSDGRNDDQSLAAYMTTDHNKGSEVASM